VGSLDCNRASSSRPSWPEHGGGRRGGIHAIALVLEEQEEGFEDIALIVGDEQTRR